MNTKWKGLRVDYKQHRLFDYILYFKEDIACNRYATRYKPGDLVYIKAENAVGVVIGCIDEVREEVRTEMSGMVCYQDIEPYNPFKHPVDAHMTDKVRKDLWIEILKNYVPWERGCTLYPVKES